jgi:uncharacterized protein YcnI
MLVALRAERTSEHPAPKGPHMPRRKIAVVGAAAALTGALALPGVAGAHVSLHPNVVPAGAFATLVLRVPSEVDGTTTAKVQVRMPADLLDVSAAPPPGWRFSEKTEKLARPVRTDDGTIDSRVTEITFSGGKVPAGQFVDLPISIVIPGKAGDVLTFKTVQTYANGQVARWIGPPDDESPAPTIDVTAKGGVLEDVAGGEAGPPAGAGTSSGAGAAGAATPAAVTRVVERGGGDHGWEIAAFVVALLAAAMAGGALLRTRR